LSLRTRKSPPPQEKSRNCTAGVAAEASASFGEVSNLAIKLAYLISRAAFHHGTQDVTAGRTQDLMKDDFTG